MSKYLNSVTIQTKSWNKNSFGLFDYESRDIQKKTLKVVGTCKSQFISAIFGINQLYWSKLLIGKLTRNEVMKDSVEIEALNETLSSPDTPNTNKESQLARLYYKNGNIHIFMSSRWILDIPQKFSWYVDCLLKPRRKALVCHQALP